MLSRGVGLSTLKHSSFRPVQASLHLQLSASIPWDTRQLAAPPPALPEAHTESLSLACTQGG